MIPRTHDRQRRSFGFTLIELVVTVTIVGILTTIAAPSFSVLIASSRIKGAASNLQMSLLRARSQAVKGNASVTVTRNGANWQSGWTVTWNDPNDSPDAGTITLVNEAAPIGVAITPTTPTSFTYLRSGRVQNNLAQTFTVNAQPAFTLASVKKDRCRTVVLETSGMPTVRRVDCP